MTPTPICPITRVVLDFDGTCTQVPLIAEEYLELYRRNFVSSVGELSEAEWQAAQNAVRKRSPEAGWTLAGPPAAPAAADPYILADESARYILRQRGQTTAPPHTLNAQAYAALPAAWREDALDTFRQLIDRGLRLHFVSNSSSTYIQGRVAGLFGTGHPALNAVSVQSDAGKFRVCELPWEDHAHLNSQNRRRFLDLPAVFGGTTAGVDRPIYIRRGAYFEALCRVFGGELELLSQTVFCGDIWEMDLAMPAALGGCVHLLDRMPPFSTYPFEVEAVKSYGDRAKQSADLAALLDWT